MKNNFTNSNYYNLFFDLELDSASFFVFGHNPSLETMDGLFIGYNKVQLYNDGTLLDEVYTQKQFSSHTSYPVMIQNIGGEYKVSVKYDDEYEQIYETSLIGFNTVGVYRNMGGVSSFRAENFELKPIYIDDITPSTEDYDGSVFGSNWHLELEKDYLNFVDYGMLPSGATGGGLVILDKIPIKMDEGVKMEITTYYNNRRYDAELNNLYGEIQARLFENVLTSNTEFEYTDVVCSPSPVPNAKTIFTRYTDEGTLYYVKPNYLISEEKGKVMQKAMYMCNPYLQYKGGVEITTETGISLFHLDNQYSPIFVGNDLVRAEFHRRSGYIVISRYDEITDNWYTANVLKITDNLKLELQYYDDDYARIGFGATTWEFHRGRPFIIVKHPTTNIRILNLVDRIYCETTPNELSIGWLEEHDTHMSTFEPQTSIQKFKQDLHIGENIRTDNFDLYEVDSNDNLIDLEKDAELSTVRWDDDIALKVDKNYTNGKLAVNFPSTSAYLKKPSNTFSLYIGKIDVDTQTSITIKARGFDENGAIHTKEGIQYGLWEQTQTFTVNSSTKDLRASFTCTDEVEYIDFVVIFNTNAQSHIRMTQLMCHEGNTEPSWDVDYSIINANNITIMFDETYYANLYDEIAPIGLCVIRPLKTPFTLRELSASKETVLAPYMKKCKEWDKPKNVFLEYLNSKAQKIDIEWEKF